MGRLDGRIRRLEQQVKGRHSSSWQARVARMGYEDLLAEVVRGARRIGMPEEWALAQPEAAVVWLDEHLRRGEKALLEAERDEDPGRWSGRAW